MSSIAEGVDVGGAVVVARLGATPLAEEVTWVCRVRLSARRGIAIFYAYIRYVGWMERKEENYVPHFMKVEARFYKFGLVGSTLSL